MASVQLCRHADIPTFHGKCARTKIRDGQVRNRPVYVAMGISIDGERDVLGLWAAPGGGGEGAKQWMTMLTELRNRGIADVCIVCCDCEDERVPFRAVA